jgi:hypothetical protein
MFAPYCPTCGHRVLLGTGRIVEADLHHPTMTVAVRCFCGTVVDAFQETPLPATGSPPHGSPAEVAPAAATAAA